MDALETTRKVFPRAHAELVTGADAQRRTAEQHARAARSRLDLWTHKQPSEPHIELTIRLCRKGIAESSALVNTEPRKKGGGGKQFSEEDHDTTLGKQEASMLRSSRRAKKEVRLASKTIGADRLLTLTSRKYLYTLDHFWKAFGEFNRLMKKKYGARWSYVVVPELHPTNNDHYHGHLAIRGHYTVDTVRFLWRRALRTCFHDASLDHTPGNIDIDYRGSQSWRVCSLARYISKYISKTLDGTDANRRKRYERSRNSSPEILKFFAPLGMTDLDIIRKVQDVTGGQLARNPVWEVYAGRDCLLIETEPLQP